MPVLRNSQSESMNQFIQDLEEKLKSHHMSGHLKKSEVFDVKPGNTFYEQMRQGKLKPNHIRMLRSDTEVSNLTKLILSPKENYSDIKAEFDNLIASYADLVDGDGKEFEERIMFTYNDLK